jgi:hypothetical protein
LAVKICWSLFSYLNVVDCLSLWIFFSVCNFLGWIFGDRCFWECSFIIVYFITGFSMSRGYNYIKDLKKNLDVYKIGFRVLDSWNVSASNGNQHMEFIIGDAKVAEIYLFFVANLLINIFFRRCYIFGFTSVFLFCLWV